MALFLLTAWRIEEYLAYAGFALLILSLLPLRPVTRILSSILGFRIGPLWVSLLPTFFSMLCATTQIFEAHQRGQLLAQPKWLPRDSILEKEKLFRAQRNMYLSLLALVIWIALDRVLALQRQIHTLREQLRNRPAAGPAAGATRGSVPPGGPATRSGGDGGSGGGGGGGGVSGGKSPSTVENPKKVQ